MKSRILLAALMTAVLVMPATTALGVEPGDQEVDVYVLPANALGINIHGGIGFQVEIGQPVTQPFGMDVTNTTDLGWEVTVDGPDLQGYYWNYCDENGNCDYRILTDNTIAKSNIVVTGGDTCFFYECDPGADTMITSYSVALGSVGEGDIPVKIMEGTAEAYGTFGFGDPYDAKVQVTAPAGSAYEQYFTVLTYTIMHPGP